MGDEGTDSPDLEALDPQPEAKRGSEASLHTTSGSSAGALGLRHRGIDYWRMSNRHAPLTFHALVQ